MGTVRKIVRPILQYICGLVLAWGSLVFFATVCPFCLGWYCKVFLPSIPQSPHAYDDVIGGIGALFIMCVTIPVGGILGILITDKLIFKNERVFLLKSIISLSISILSSAVIFWFVLLILNYEVSLGDMRTLFFIVICIPGGVILGILLADKLVFKRNKMLILQIIVSLLMGIWGSDIIVWMLFRGIEIFGWIPKIRHITFGFEPFIITSVFFSLIGYNVVGLFVHKEK
jgi:hypothetical protein